MTQVAVTDSESPRLVVMGTRIPRFAWAEVSDLGAILQEAKNVLGEAHESAKSIRLRAHAEGHAEGLTQAQAVAARHLVDAQRLAYEFAHDSQQRVISLALAVLGRIVPKLRQSEVVPALILEALKDISAEQAIRVYVAPSAVDVTVAVLAEWQQEHARVEPPSVIPDPGLQAFDCAVESDLGRIEAGLNAQLAAVNRVLVAVAGTVRE